MEEQKPEEMESQIPVTDTPKPPEEVNNQAPEVLPIPQEVKYQAPEVSQQFEEVRPQVIGASQPPEEKASGMAISAMVVGIVGILCSWAIVFSLPLGITALVLGVIEFKRIKDLAASEKGRGMAITGIILGSLTLCAVLTYIVVIAFTAVSFATGMSAFLPSIIDKFGTFY
jgi:uncharacterized membrane protein